MILKVEKAQANLTPMVVWVIGTNPLFRETVSQALAGSLEAELRPASPDETLQRIQTEPGQVLLVDEAIPPGMLKRILKQTQGESPTRLILLNTTCNDFIVIDFFRGTLGKVEDLVRFMKLPNSEGGCPRATPNFPEPIGGQRER